MKVKVYTLNSFAKSPNGGNPAGVVLDADKYTENNMHQIAKAVGFSETAFVQLSDKADFKVRFFTPNSEVDLCGHATIATFSLLAALGKIRPGTYKQETKAGILKIEVFKNNSIFMNQKLPKFFEKINRKEIAESLNSSEDIIPYDFPIQVVSTGLKDIMIPIKSIKELNNIRPNLNKISEISKKYGVIGYHLFTFETKLDSTAYCRNFAPLYDISEEAATGTSNGALSCYLYKYRKISAREARNLVYEQGYSMKMPSEILASLKIKNKKITEIRIGGMASKFKEKIISI